MKLSKEKEKRLLILFSVYQNGGSAKKSEVLNYLKTNNFINLHAEDLVFRSTRSEETWRNSFAYIRQHLILEGYLNHHSHDQWEINDCGKQYLLNLINDLEHNGQNFYRYINDNLLQFISQTKENIQSQFAYDLLEDTVKKDVLAIEEENYSEGKHNLRFVNFYERKVKLRTLAIKFHGLNCMGCNFNFEKTYGERGRDFIEVHHIKPVSEFSEETIVNPKTDLIVLCSNCHRIVHRERDLVLPLEELKKIVNVS